jgi:hypothetical protein
MGMSQPRSNRLSVDGGYFWLFSPMHQSVNCDGSSTLAVSDEHLSDGETVATGNSILQEWLPQSRILSPNCLSARRKHECWPAAATQLPTQAGCRIVLSRECPALYDGAFIRLRVDRACDASYSLDPITERASVHLTTGVSPSLLWMSRTEWRGKLYGKKPIRVSATSGSHSPSKLTVP